ncbi:MAG: 2Fe-2S iron-sulfur cluster binding domain-containing protein, partial [Proteobacteria bacterium]|nr:2Fe-2S iron-sulfur cluster binding domain-containing protein [Pseudomonadota bacterium]
MPDDALVVFTPSGRRGRFPTGTTLLDAARSLGVDIDSVCGGRALCGRCQVQPAVGEFAKHGVSSRAENLTPFSETERRYAADNGIADGRRLSCSTQILGDLVIDVPSESQVHRQVVRKRAEVHEIELDAAVRVYYVEVQEPDMHDPAGDLRRLKEALEFEWQLQELQCDFEVLHGLQTVLRDGNWQVTVAVYEDRDIIAVWPGFHDRIFGMAVDVGSTTIAAHLCDLSSGEVVASAGVMNPQIRFGEDLMSRVSYVMMNPGGEAEWTAVVRETLQALATEVAEQAGVTPEDILDVCVVGNPIMHHLLLGMNPVELGGAPFALATDEALRV